MKRKHHINEFRKTGFVGHGNRAAGMGILHDRYDEESGGWVYGTDSVMVKLPLDSLTTEERKALSGPVIVKRLEEEKIE